MARLDPTLLKHVWKPWFWWRVLKTGDNWRSCERCGFLNECLPYGRTVRENYAALEKLGRPQRESVRGPEEQRVCIRCCMEMRESYGDMPRMEGLD